MKVADNRLYPPILACTIVFLLAQVLVGQSPQAQDQPFEDKLLPALFNKQIQRELELVDDQKEELTYLLDTLKRQKESLGVELREYAQTASAEELKAKRQELIDGFETQKKETQSTIMNVLLPHQKLRLRQATAQLMIRELAKQKKVSTGILAPEMLEFLDIGDEQARQIEDKAIEIKKRLAEQIRKLTEEANTELLGELTRQQRAKYQKLVGDPIK